MGSPSLAYESRSRNCPAQNRRKKILCLIFSYLLVVICMPNREFLLSSRSDLLLKSFTLNLICQPRRWLTTSCRYHAIDSNYYLVLLTTNSDLDAKIFPTSELLFHSYLLPLATDSRHSGRMIVLLW